MHKKIWPMGAVRKCTGPPGRRLLLSAAADRTPQGPGQNRPPGSPMHGKEAGDSS